MGSGKGISKRINTTKLKNKLKPDYEVGELGINNELLADFLKKKKISPNRNLVFHYTKKRLKAPEITDEIAIDVLNKYFRELLGEGILTNGVKISNPENYEIQLEDRRKEYWQNNSQIKLVFLPANQVLNTVHQYAKSNSPIYLAGSKIMEDARAYQYNGMKNDQKRDSSAGSIIQSLGETINIHDTSMYDPLEPKADRDFLKKEELLFDPTGSLYSKHISLKNAIGEADISRVEYYLGEYKDKLSKEETIYILNEAFTDAMSYAQEEREILDKIVNPVVNPNLNIDDFKFECLGEYVGIRNKTYNRIVLTYKGVVVNKVLASVGRLRTDVHTEWINPQNKKDYNGRELDIAVQGAFSSVVRKNGLTII